MQILGEQRLCLHIHILQIIFTYVILKEQREQPLKVNLVIEVEITTLVTRQSQGWFFYAKKLL